MSRTNKRTADASIYYDYTHILSYNAFISLIIGIRGVGKTYGAKKLIINDYVKRGREFIYLRRFKTDLANIKTFFTDVAVEFPDWEFRVNGHTAQCRPADSDDPWQTMGYFIALSGAASKKSVAYPNVHRIVFDEFLLSKGFVRYLPNEYHAFLEFINTVDRNQDRVSIIMIANAVDLANPYFLEWKVQPSDDGIRHYANRLVVADFPKSEDYAEYARSSNIGKLTAGSDYERYAIGNEFVAGSTTLIARKHPDARYIFTITHAGWELALWMRAGYEWYVTRKQPKNQNLYALTVRGSDESARVLEPSDKLTAMIKGAYRARAMRFDTAQTHTAFQNVLAFLNTR